MLPIASQALGHFLLFDHREMKDRCDATEAPIKIDAAFARGYNVKEFVLMVKEFLTEVHKTGELPMQKYPSVFLLGISKWGAGTMPDTIPL